MWMQMAIRVVPLTFWLVVSSCGLGPPWATASVRNDHALDSLALATAIEYGIRGTGIEVPLVCASVSGSDPQPELLAMLQKRRSSILRMGSTCHVDTTGGPRTGRSLVAERSGGALRGISVNVGPRTTVTDSSVSFMVSYYQNYLSSADWRCEARRRGKRWVLHNCQLERIS